MRVGGWPAVFEEEALRLGLAAKIGAIPITTAGAADGDRGRFRACGFGPFPTVILVANSLFPSCRQPEGDARPVRL